MSTPGVCVPLCRRSPFPSAFKPPSPSLLSSLSMSATGIAVLTISHAVTDPRHGSPFSAIWGVADLNRRWSWRALSGSGRAPPGSGRHWFVALITPSRAVLVLVGARGFAMLVDARGFVVPVVSSQLRSWSWFFQALPRHCSCSVASPRLHSLKLAFQVRAWSLGF